MYYKLYLFNTATKFMVQNDLCNSCDNSKTCQQVYANFGNSKGPSITMKVIVALLLPIVVFIVSLVLFEKFLENLIMTKHLRTAIGFPAALAVTFTIILITRFINEQFSKKR